MDTVVYLERTRYMPTPDTNTGFAGYGKPLTTSQRRSHGLGPKRTKAPSIKTMERWMNDGVAKATDGCRVEPDGTCPHGARSWMMVLGVI